MIARVVSKAAGQNPSEGDPITFELAGVGILHVRPDGHWLRCNAALERTLGRSGNDLHGPVDATVYPSDTQAEVIAQRRQCLAHPEVPIVADRRYLRADGGIGWLSVTLSGVRASDGDYVIEVIADITAQRELIDNLTAREALHVALLRTAVDAIITTDAFGIIASINPAGERMFGYSAAELIGQNLSMLMPKPYSKDHDSYMKRYRDTGVGHIIGIGREVLAMRRDGRVFPIDLAVSEVKSGQWHFFKGIIRDLTERKRLESQILEISDREQKRIGQDLHDGIGQQMTGIGFLARSLQLRLTETQSPEADVARQLAEHVGQAVVQTRALARGLHPVAPVPGGLNSALADLTSTLEATYGVKCRVSCEDLVWFKDATIATHIYRIIQEAANNAIKHAKPQTIDIVLAEHRKTLHVTIEDDGIGFPEKLPEHPGLGLQIMSSRASLIGAKLTFSRREPTGTVIHFSLPYESREPG